MSLRIGLAGLGVHGSRYARHLLEGDVPGATLTAVARADEARGRDFAEQHGLVFVASAEDLATHPAVDAVVVVLPPDRHPDVVCACLANGRAVLVEKPMAPSVAAARRIVDLQRSSGTPLMVGQTLRFDPLIQRLQAERPTIGALRLVSLNQRFEPSDRKWIDSPGCGGLFLNTGVHGFDLLRLLIGARPVSVWAEARRFETSATEDAFVATLRFEPGGVLALMDNARSTDSRSGRIELIGSGGQLWADHAHRTLQRVEGRRLVDLGPVAAEPTLPRTLRGFVRSLEREEPPPISAFDGLAAVAMVDAAMRSAASGQRVAIEDLPDGY